MLIVSAACSLSIDTPSCRQLFHAFGDDVGQLHYLLTQCCVSRNVALNAAEIDALTIAEMIAAMRHGLARRPNIFPLSSSAARTSVSLSWAGYRRISGSLADASALIGLGWVP
jgi:hypothetical protein